MSVLLEVRRRDHQETNEQLLRRWNRALKKTRVFEEIRDATFRPAKKRDRLKKKKLRANRLRISEERKKQKLQNLITEDR